jgi:TolB protein
MRFEYGSWQEQIFLINCDGTGLRQLTLENDVRESFPRISPDGKKIALARCVKGDTYDIYVMNPDGSGRTRITNSPDDDDMPSWSPDGSRLAFMSTRDGNAEIYVMSSDGSRQKRLTNDPARDMLPAWSPDGSKIAFLSNRGGSNRWWLMNADGSDQRLMADINVWDEIINVSPLLLQGTWGGHSNSKGLFFAPVVTMEKQCVISISVAEGKQGSLTYWDSYNLVEAPDGSVVFTTLYPDTNSFYLRLMSAGSVQDLTSNMEQAIASSCAVLAGVYYAAP